MFITAKQNTRKAYQSGSVFVLRPPPRLLLETRLVLEYSLTPQLVFETRLLLEEIRYD